jgi:hypothetical protein
MDSRRSKAGFLIAGLALLIATMVTLAGGAGSASSATAAPASHTVFSANLTGTAEVPPSGSAATGFATVALSDDHSTITVSGGFSNLQGNANGAHIHGPAPPGMNAGIIFPLSGFPSAPSGSIPEQSFPITPTQLAQLQAGNHYVNVHSTVFPGGEIRGQLGPATVFRANLTGADEVPPSGSLATGSATVVLSGDQSVITVFGNFSNLQGNANGAHIHGPAPPGMNAGIIFPLTGFPSAPSGSIPQQSFPITPTQLAQLQAGDHYVNVHSTVFPGGEIRGQLGLAPPTAVRISSATAVRTRHGVVLRWRTAQETTLLGFNIVREQKGKLLKLNRTLIRSVGGTARGHAYSWLDRRPPSQRVSYRIQAVRFDGSHAWITLVSA